MLIANPKATSTSRRVRDLLFRAFSGDLDLEFAETAHRGHAVELAREAATGKYDVVLALGGDGTVNETVNGLLAAGPSADVPALAVLPIGSTNVFARALGLPAEPIGATRLVLDALRAGRHRWIGLGMADDRYFTFCAGLGLDAEVIRVVERRRDTGRRPDPTLYVRVALREFFTRTDRVHPALTLERPGHPPVTGLFLSFVANTAPWTYLGRHPVDPFPRAHFSRGLDVFAMRSMAVRPVLAAVAGMLLPGDRPVRGRDVVNVHDASRLTLRADRPIAFQLDGDYLGERTEVQFRSVPRAIRIVI
ncbi:diacylglycerol/lipid kinase family protein [Thermomonospora amylolytica]|uniref:diacylglycerol/lipid kinase family protein n=1 Tax=Thermomonospora amylolytica TaxID=1411117 RepID=UPI002D7A2E5D|nr:diacylglycerol kinase family protein [Thermomonospora amylolytica]